MKDLFYIRSLKYLVLTYSQAVNSCDAEGTKAIRIHDEFTGVYKKVVIKDNKIIGAVLFGDTADGTRLMQMIREETDISGMAKTAILTDSSRRRRSFWCC